MTLETDEFIRRFLIHVLPRGFHRIRHYGLFANTVRADNFAHARELLSCEIPDKAVEDEGSESSGRDTFICPVCSAPMTVIDI